MLARVVTVAVLVALAASAGAQDRVKEASHLFDQGQELYKQGRYTEAIKAFEGANAIAPHPAAQFNIARCHENLGNRARALEAYRALLGQTTEPAKRLDIEQRIRRLLARPVKVFVHSEPKGAAIFVDAKEQPAPGVTPAVVELTPGRHVLLLELEGHRLAVRRVTVEMDREQLVQVTLEPLPRPAPQKAPCPEPKPCPKPRPIVDPDNLHLHLGLLGSVGWTTELPTGIGPGVQLLVTFRRLVFGGHFTWLFTGEQPLDQPVDIGQNQYTKTDARWLLALAEGGYMFPLRSAFLYATLGMGVSTERVVFVGTTPSGSVDDFVREEFGFAWSAGGGIEAFAAPWVSFGGAARIGAIHGHRVDRDKPDARDYGWHHYPFGTLWATMTFHL